MLNANELSSSLLMDRLAEKRAYAIKGSSFEASYLAGPRPDVPTIVMLHGGLGSISHWGHFPQRLAERAQCNVFLYSRLGHGASDPFASPLTASFMAQEAIFTLPEILRQAGIADPILLGHSDGASIALLHGIAFPGAQRAIIAIAPHVNVETKAITAIQQLRLDWPESLLRQRLARHHDRVDDLFSAWSQVWLSAEFAGWDVCSKLAAILAPLLVVQGTDDEFATSAQILAIQASVTRARLAWISECAHEPFRTHPSETLNAIVGFIGTLSTGL